MRQIGSFCKVLLFIVLSLTLTVFITAQRVVTETTMPSQRELETKTNAGMPTLREVEQRARESAVWPGKKDKPIDKKERERIEKLKEPEAADLDIYRAYTNRKDAGVLRVFPKRDCGNGKIIFVSGPCAAYPPGGFSFGFRHDATLTDLSFSEGEIVADGFLSQQLIVRLKDSDPNDWRSAPELDFLRKFVPETTFDGARKQYLEISKGLTVDGATFSLSERAEIGAAYAFRTIAFKKLARPVRRSRMDHGTRPDQETYYKQLSMLNDNRIDQTVVFRLVKQYEDGSILIVWEEIETRKSPVLKATKDNVDPDFRTI